MEILSQNKLLEINLLDQVLTVFIYCQIALLQDSCCCSVTHLCPTLCNPMDCSMPCFSVLQISWSLIALAFNPISRVYVGLCVYAIFYTFIYTKLKKSLKSFHRVKIQSLDLNIFLMDEIEHLFHMLIWLCFISLYFCITYLVVYILLMDILIDYVLLIQILSPLCFS